jgi:hypothetical protein
VGQADLSAQALRDLQVLTAGVPEGATVILDDDWSERARNTTLVDAFGTLLDGGFLMTSGRHVHFWIEPPPTNATMAGLAPPCPTCASLHLALVDGRLRLALTIPKSGCVDVGWGDWEWHDSASAKSHWRECAFRARAP